MDLALRPRPIEPGMKGEAKENYIHLFGHQENVNAHGQ